MSITGLQARSRLREAIGRRHGWPIITIGVHDVFSAQLAERSGFDSVVLGGFAVSATRLGRPDAGYLQLDDMTAVARNITSRSAVAVVADCDTGWGNAITAMRTTEEMISAGAAAIIVEDQVSPKRCGNISGKMVIPAEEFVGKLRAIDRVRRELAPDLVVIARCDARGVAGGTIEEVIRRGRMYREAGADVIFPEALPSLEDLERCSSDIDAPLVYNLSLSGVTQALDESQLARCNVCLVFLPSIALQLSTCTVVDAFEKLHAKGLSYVPALRASLLSHPVGKDMYGLVGFPEIMALEEEFLPTEQQLARYQGSIGYGLEHRS